MGFHKDFHMHGAPARLGRLSRRSRNNFHELRSRSTALRGHMYFIDSDSASLSFETFGDRFGFTDLDD